jgi:hypothetical protein
MNKRSTANRAWGIDIERVRHHVTPVFVSGDPPPWAIEMADLFEALADAIQSGSPEARTWAVMQLRALGNAFHNAVVTQGGSSP